MKRFFKTTKIFIFCIFFSFFTLKANAELVSSSIFNYQIDLPEMFELTDCSQDERSVLFRHRLLPVQTVIRVWSQENFKDSKEALQKTQEKLTATGEIAPLKWRNRNCAVSQIELSEKALGEKMSGWAVCIPLIQSKDFLTVLSFAPEEKAYDCEQFILSVLDSVMIDRGSFTENGIITAFAFPKAGTKKITLNIDGKKIETTLDKDDAQANQFVVDREFAVFKLFVNQDCWKEAWQRFYRMIAKDGMARVKKAAFDISNASECSDDVLAQKLLNWVQEFSYERPSATAEKADFTNIPATLEGKGSDCDSRSMLLMLLYKNLGLDSVMFISVDYSHAMVGINLPGKQGQTCRLDGKEYLFGETTAKKLTFGMIAEDMQDRSKWIPVELYE